MRKSYIRHSVSLSLIVIVNNSKTNMKTKYILGTILMGAITIYSFFHIEKYGIPFIIIFSCFTIFSIIMGLIDNNK